MSAYSIDEQIYTWGRNNDGELGDGTTSDKYLPTNITSQFNLEEGETIVSMKLSFSHSLLLTSTGRLFSWGRNEQGQIGEGSFSKILSPTNITLYLGLANGETIDNIYVGGHQSTVITSNGRILVWGRNVYGQLADGTKTNQPSPVDITTRVSLDPSETILDVFMGANYTILMTEQDTFYAWGINPDGVFANGTTISALMPISISFEFSILNIIEQVVEVLYPEELIDYIPVLDGQTFDGWYMDSNLTVPLLSNIMPNQHIILYAKWISN